MVKVHVYVTHFEDHAKYPTAVIEPLLRLSRTLAYRATELDKQGNKYKE